MSDNLFPLSPAQIQIEIDSLTFDKLYNNQPGVIRAVAVDDFNIQYNLSDTKLFNFANAAGELKLSIDNTALLPRTATTLAGVINKLNLDTKGLANDGSDNFNWNLSSGKFWKIGAAAHFVKLLEGRIDINVDEIPAILNFIGRANGTTFNFFNEDNNEGDFVFSGDAGEIFRVTGADSPLSPFYLKRDLKLDGVMRGSFLTTGFALDETGVTALTGSGTATSLIGVINDLNVRITALEP